MSVKQTKSNWKKYALSFATIVAVLAGIAEISGYSIKDILGTSETTEQPSKLPMSAQKVKTLGDNSPSVITEDGDVNINYRETKMNNDNDSSKKIENKN